MPPYAPAIATILAAIFGGLLLLYVHGRNAQRAASTKLRAAFSNALGTIEAAQRHDIMDPKRPNVSKVLRDSFITHAAAVEEYRPFLRSKDRREYERAWQQYRGIAYDNKGIEAEFLAEHINEDSPLSVLRTRINAVLAFAET